MRKIAFYCAKLGHYFVPYPVLLSTLRYATKIPLLRRYVPMFDPNEIRTVHGFDLSEREMNLEGEKWTLVVNPRDHIGFQSLLKNMPFEMAVYYLAERLESTKRKVIIDIGANIGTASVPICSKNNYELIAVEASKDNAKLLAKNVLNNGIKAKLFLYALVDEVTNEYVKLYSNKGNTGSNSLIENWNYTKGTQEEQFIEFVPSKTFDEVVNEARLNVNDVMVVKIDVEGMEEAVLNGAKDFLVKNSAPIILEYLNKQIQHYTGSDLSGVLNILTKFNYSLYALDDKAHLLEFDPGNSYENIVAVKENSELTKLLLASS